jgi:outer membrane biosynthesis protein TonB
MKEKRYPMNLSATNAGRLAAALLTVVAVTGCGGGAVAPIGPSVPDVVGQPLDLAKTRLQAVGFTGHSEDLMRDRNQLVDSNWTVCTQDPRPGPAEEGSDVELGVVRDSETCPGSVPTTTAAPTSTPPPTTPAAAPRPAPKPAPKPVPKPNPQPADDRQPAGPPPVNDDEDDDRSSGGSGSVGTVHPGSYCDPPGAGVSSTGKPMVCAPGSDGRNRWQGA